MISCLLLQLQNAGSFRQVFRNDRQCDGHGLSYTTFSYGPLALSTKELSDNDELTVEISVKNTGERIGSQVLQLYVVPHTCHAIRPMKELKSFEKVNLKPGEERRVAFRLDRKAFEYFSEAQDRKSVV